MIRIPISIEKIKVKTQKLFSDNTDEENSETIKYLFKLEEKGQQWEKTFICGRD